MNMKTKLTALLMSILMIMTMIPAVAFTASAAGYVAEVSTDGGVTYTQKASFKEAWDAAVDGAIIRLLQNTDMGATANSNNNGRGLQYGGKTVTLDLNGCILLPPTADTSGKALIAGLGVNHFCLNSATAGLIIKDSNPNKSHWYYEHTGTPGLYVWDDAKQYDGQEGYTYYMIPGGALTGGRQQLKDDTYTEINNQKVGSINVQSGAQLTILGGNFIGNVGIDSGAVRFNNGNGHLTMSGGLFIGNICISGGQGYENMYAQSGSLAAGSVITGGTLVGKKGIGGASAFYEGFLGESVLLPDSKYENGYTFTPTRVESGGVVAVYGSDGVKKWEYTSLEAAYNAFEDGDIWVLLKDCNSFNSNANNRGIVIGGGKSLTVDLNGYALKAPLNAYGKADNDGKEYKHFWIQANSTLTIRDSHPEAEHWYYESPETAGLYVLDDGKDDGVVAESAYFMIPGGVITGGRGDANIAATTAKGGSIMVMGGVLNIERGNFIGNDADGVGGVLFVDVNNNVFPALNIAGGYFVGNHSDVAGADLFQAVHLNADPAEGRTLTGISAITGGIFSDDLTTISGIKGLIFETHKQVAITATGYGFAAGSEPTWYEVTWDGKVETNPSTHANSAIIYRGLQRSANGTGKLALRLIAEVKLADLTGNSYAGFYMSLSGQDSVKRLPVSNYYTKLLVQSDVDAYGMTAIVPSSEENVLIAIVIDDVPESGVIDLKLTPYVDFDGTNEQTGTSAIIRIYNGEITGTGFTNKYLPYTTVPAQGTKTDSDGNYVYNPDEWTTNSNGSSRPAHDDTYNMEYHVLTLGDSTYRGYLGQYNWLPDNSGFICRDNMMGSDGRTSNMYYYDVEKQELVFLDRTIGHYVNPSDGLVYYIQIEGLNKRMMRVNAKTLVREQLYTTTDPNLELGVEVSNDGRYALFKYYGDGSGVLQATDTEHIGASGEYVGYKYFGCIDMETDTICYEGWYLPPYYGEGERPADYKFNLNHFILNPEYPNLILFHHESADTPGQVRLTVYDMSNGTWKDYKPLSKYEDEEYALAGHAFWSRDGEYITMTHYDGSDDLVITDKDFNVLEGYPIRMQLWGWYNVGCHNMVDANHKWAVGDYKFGVVLIDIEQAMEQQKTDGGDPFYAMTPINTQIADQFDQGHPNHPHPEISADGKIISWGQWDPNGVLGIGWVTNPYWNADTNTWNN